MIITITIPGDVRGKGRPRFRAQGGFARAYTDAKTVSAENWLRCCAVEQARLHAPLDGPLAVTMAISVVVPQSWSKRKRADALAGRLRPTGKPDLDNCVKLLDALNKIIWNDDSQIVAMAASKAYAEQAQAVLEIRSL